MGTNEEPTQLQPKAYAFFLMPFITANIIYILTSWIYFTPSYVKIMERILILPQYWPYFLIFIFNSGFAFLLSSLCQICLQVSRSSEQMSLFTAALCWLIKIQNQGDHKKSTKPPSNAQEKGSTLNWKWEKKKNTQPCKQPLRKEKPCQKWIFRV